MRDIGLASLHMGIVTVSCLNVSTVSITVQAYTWNGSTANYSSAHRKSIDIPCGDIDETGTLTGVISDFGSGDGFFESPLQVMISGNSGAMGGMSLLL